MGTDIDICILGSLHIPSCPGSFSCNNRTCVNMSQVCNGIPDCPRAEDELVCGEFSYDKNNMKGEDDWKYICKANKIGFTDLV